MATETSLERQKRLAAENNEFEQWRQAYRAEQQMADQWGGGLINGRPAATVVDATQVEVLPANPQGTAGNPALVAQNAQRIRNEGLAANEVNPSRAQLYDRFVQSQGINPNTIGAARTNSSGGLNVPSLREQEAAESARLADNGRRSRNNIAAGRLDRRGAYGQAAELRDQTAALLPRVGGRSAENARNYYLDYFLNRVEPEIGPIGNGFKPVDYNPSANPYGFNV